MPRPSSASILLLVFTLATALASAGCASVYQVTVEASARTDGMPPSRSYRIEDRNAVAGTRTLRQAEIANHVKTALSAQGLYEAPDAQSADMVVEISYGIGPPRVQRMVYQALAFGRPVPVNECSGPAPEGVAREMMGYTPMADTTVTREKHMSIHARENRSREGAHPPEDFWRVHVSIENESDDLRGHLPILASAAMDHIGRTTGGPAALTLRSDDEAVRFIRRGL